MALKLGGKEKLWSQKGRAFLSKRLNARSKEDASLAEYLIDNYLSGALDNQSREVSRKAALYFDTGVLDAESIIIIILGRRPKNTTNGVEEHGSSLTPREIEGQKILADVLTQGRRYINKNKRKNKEHSKNEKERISTEDNICTYIKKDNCIDLESKKLLNTTCNEGRSKLVYALQNRPEYMDEKLELLKAEQHQLERTDYLWHALLVSFSTMGNSRGFGGLIEDENNYKRIAYQELEGMSAEQRVQRLEETLSQAKVRMPFQKAQWLSANFVALQSMGGLEAAKQSALAQPGAKAKIRFMKQFSGIGDKYARNLWMDVYHPDFHESIAIDDRINKISVAMGCKFNNYEEQEKFFLDIAHDADLQGWELDRLLYNYRDYYLHQLNCV